MKKYAYNNLDTNLVLRGGYITLKPKTWNEVREMDYTMGSYKAVEDARMVEIKEFDSPPDMNPFQEPVETVSVIKQAPGMTEEELKAHLEAKAMKGPESLGTTTPKIGRAHV